jgi:hypothetical protein
MATALESPHVETGATALRWNLAQRILFRFACAYFALYYLPYQGHSSVLSGLPGTIALNRASRALVEWTAARVFHLSGAIAVYPKVNGSGDTTLDYIHNLLILVAAAAIAMVWSILDRKRENYRRLHAWLRIWLRYSLAVTLYEYGFAKIFPLQFGPPGFYKLMEPLHDFSPMGLLWTFMGYSPVYTIFAGAMEAAGATLLLFRRTTTLGALVSAAVLANVVMLNFCYDVPVKLYSLNLLLAAIFLAAADFPRLVRVFALNQTARPLNLDAILFSGRAARIATVTLKTLLIGFFLFVQIRGGISAYRGNYSYAKPPLYGIWRVENFVLNGGEMPAIEGDANRWRLIMIERPQFASVKMMNDSTRSFQTRYEPGAHRVTFVSSPNLVFTWTNADEGHATLDSTTMSIKLEKMDASKFLLTSRGFHWINERPFNR